MQNTGLQMEDQMLNLTRTLLSVFSSGSHVNDRSSVVVKPVDDATAECPGEHNSQSKKLAPTTP